MKGIIRIVLLALVYVIITSCDRKVELEYDKDNYYIATVTDEYGNYPVIGVYLDSDDEYVTRMTISQFNDVKKDDTVKSLIENYPAEDDKAYGYTLIDKEDSGYGKDWELIYINFYEIDDLSKIDDLIGYIGLDQELKDGYLSDEELLRSDTFRYKNILADGEYAGIKDQ